MTELQLVPPEPEPVSRRIERLRLGHGDNPDAITTALLEELGVRYPASLILWNIVKDSVRGKLRETERRRLASRRRDDRSAAARERARESGAVVTLHPQSLAALRTGPLAFLDAKVWRSFLGPQGWKFYHDLTREECTRIAAGLRRGTDPVLASIRGYEWSAKILKEKNAATLAAISDEDLLAELPEEGIRP